ncbi:MAG: Hsp70 family protein [Verrucomicrobia bacterium]|nr:Hsp70 family protein [Verrucomicrobiota bacterium]MCH8511627.1 hsp70 family protein [Kiritimatiellia bacterium]
MSFARFAIGIDLGTSNSALASVLLADDAAESVPFSIPQQDGADTRTSALTLPSFLYFPPDKKAPVAGLWAREQSATQADRVVHSAKSWLCHPAVDREGKLLPWQSESVPAAQKLSPVEASAAYLIHLRRAWDEAHPDAPMAEQLLALTVPASFDAAAQQLTLEAAALAGLPEATFLLEEPQAAFTRWLESHRDALDALIPADRPLSILVCDIGGGTSDFSLFTVRAGDPPLIRRVAVSEHLLLGGDNLDRFLAHRFRREFENAGPTLTARQWAFLLSESRRLKEALLSEKGRVGSELVLPASGSGLFGETRTLPIHADDLREALLENFFPLCDQDARPLRPKSGLREMGLPYAKDAAVTRHLATFLREHPAVDAVLFNGGTLLATALRERLLHQLEAWTGQRPLHLENPEADLAVARGAAVHRAKLHRRQSPIEAGSARSIYLETVDRKRRESHLLCVLPRGAHPEQVFRIDQHPLKVLVDTPVRFQVFDSIHRPDDTPGMLLEAEGDAFHALPPMQTVISVSKKQPRPANNLVEVAVEARINAGGLLKVALVSCDKNWKGKGHWELVFNLRAREETEGDDLEVVSKQVEAAREEIERVYGKKAEKDPRLARHLFKTLEKTLKGDRKNWTRQECRHLWPALAAGITRRDRSPDHEAIWLMLAGFVLRPGFGVEMDGFRISELWRLHDLGLSFPREARGRTQLWILWRRVAAGLDAAQQKLIAETWLGPLGSPGDHPPELVRLAGALERVPAETRQTWIEVILRTLVKKKPNEPAPYYWALGRMLGRIPFGGGPETVLTPQTVVQAFDVLREKADWTHPELTLAFLRAARITDEPGLDLPAPDRARIIEHLEKAGSTPEALQPLRECVPQEEADRVSLFGESLPAGLTLGSS